MPIQRSKNSTWVRSSDHSRRNREMYSENYHNPYREIFIRLKNKRMKATLTCNVCGEDVSDTKLTHECHVCCDGECHHDDCCGKVPDNCPLKKLGNKYKEHHETK